MFGSEAVKTHAAGRPATSFGAAAAGYAGMALSRR